MITVEVKTASGNSWTTGINCTLEEAKDYYIGQFFLTRDERIEEVTSVQEVFEFDQKGNFKG